MRVLHEDVAGLADAGEQFVDGLGGVDDGFLRAGAVFAHGVIAAVEGVEGGVWQPGFVKMQVVDVAVECLLDELGVVEHAVVGGLGEGEDAGLDCVGVEVLEQRVGADFGANAGGVKFAFGDGADDAKVVARGLEKDGDGAGHDDGVEDAFVAVAVDDDDVCRGDGVVPDDFVGGGGAVGDEKTVVGVENARRIAFALANGTIVVEELAEFFDGVADVCAQHVFAVELVIHLADGAF